MSSAPGEAPAAPETRIEMSRGFAAWLGQMGASLAFTSYQTGKLFLVGRLKDGRVSVHQQTFPRAMGVSVQKNRLYLASLFQIWRLENVLAPHERANRDFDALYVPRNAQTIGDVDIHELGIDAGGRVIFVNTRFSCLAAFSPRFGFKPLWKPPFISRLAAEDRCHLNGLAMADGAPRYVTAVSRSDSLAGWRERRHEGGVLIDLADDRIVTERLSMPHSPRWYQGQLWALDSGRGQLIRIDPQTGAVEDIAFCPGFLRGLAFLGHHALVTVSLPRGGAFDGLALAGELERRDAEPWCGVLAIDTRAGGIVEFIRLAGEIRELFDIAVIPGTACPMAIGTDSPEMRTMLSFDPDFGPLLPDSRNA